MSPVAIETKMSPEIASWLLEGAKVFLADPQLLEWNSLPRNYFLSILKQALGIDAEEEGLVLRQAANLLTLVVSNNYTARNIPLELEEWRKEMEKARAEKRKIDQGVLKRVEAEIEQFKRLVVPLAHPIEPAKTGIKGVAPQEKMVAAEQAIDNQIQAFLQTHKTLADNPEKTKRLAQEIKIATIIQVLTTTPKKQITPEEYQKALTVLEPEIDNQLQEQGVRFSSAQIKSLTQTMAAKTITEANALISTRVVSAPKAPTALIPKKAGFLPAVFNRVINFPAVASIKSLTHLAGPELLSVASRVIPPEAVAVKEFRNVVAGIFATNLEEKEQAFEVAGLPVNHSIRIGLRAQIERQRQYETTHKKMIGPLRSYYQWSRVSAGKRSLFRIHDRLTQIFTFGRIKRFEVVKNAVYRRTLKPIFSRLGKTTIGQAFRRAAARGLAKIGLAAIPSGVTQVAAVALLVKDFWGPLKRALKYLGGAFLGWLLLLALLGKGFLIGALLGGLLGAYLGLQLGLLFGPFAIIAVPVFVLGGFIIGSIVGGILGFLTEHLVLPWIQDKLVSVWGGAKSLLSTVGNFFSGAWGTISGFFTSLGSSLWGFLTGAAGGVAGFFTGVASGLGGFLSALSTISIPSALPAIAAVVAPATVGVLTVLVMTNTSSAFIPPRPVSPAELGPMPTVAPSPTGLHLAELVVYRLNNECGIEKVSSVNWVQTQKCLEASNLLNKQIIVENFKVSVTSYTYLQCVGFVAGVEEALGHVFPKSGYPSARNYLERVPPSYRRITPLGVQVGDLAIWLGPEGSDGHMAVVVRKEGEVKIVVAQAWGNDGQVDMTETTVDNPSGFIRAL